MMTSGLLYLGLFPAAPHFEPNLSEQIHIPVMGRCFLADIKRGLHEDESLTRTNMKGTSFYIQGSETQNRECVCTETPEVRSGGTEREK